MNPTARARLESAFGEGFRPDAVIEAARLREQLAVAVEEFNAATDAQERVALHLEIDDLRSRLTAMEGGQ